jgi:hypothetical protein
MLRTIIKILKNNFYYNQKYNRTITLGRWKIEKNDYMTDIKINNANEDHCGTCNYTKK